MPRRCWCAEVKAAGSSRYHPDSTALPLEVAAHKFMRLKEAHTVLSNPEERRLYDLAAVSHLPLAYSSDLRHYQGRQDILLQHKLCASKLSNMG